MDEQKKRGQKPRYSVRIISEKCKLGGASAVARRSAKPSAKTSLSAN